MAQKFIAGAIRNMKTVLLYYLRRGNPMIDEIIKDLDNFDALSQRQKDRRANGHRGKCAR